MNEQYVKASVMSSGSDKSEYSDHNNRVENPVNLEKNKNDKYNHGVICRDFLRDSCKRGSDCKYYHPPKKNYYFCHDYQNGGCRRNNCTFIHSSREDEKQYKATGELPDHLTNMIVWLENDRASNSFDVGVISEEDDAPICKKLFFSRCKRGSCRYKHISLNDYHKIKRSHPHVVNDKEHFFESCIDYDRNRREDYHEHEFKRSRTSGYRDDNDLMDARLDTLPIYENGKHYSTRPQPERTYMMLEEENMMLRERVSELKKRVDDLQVTNEFLLEQNAQLRIREKNTTGLTTVTVPAVTITNTVPGANQIQQAPTPQQMVNAAIRTVTASVATVPVSIAAVTPVSIAAVSMAPVQQIAAPVVTMAQQPVAAPPDSQVPGPLPMSISATTAPLVSYPIVSRTVMQAPPDLRH